MYSLKPFSEGWLVLAVMGILAKTNRYTEKTLARFYILPLNLPAMILLFLTITINALVYEVFGPRVF